jgi:hypothetical protein
MLPSPHPLPLTQTPKRCDRPQVRRPATYACFQLNTNWYRQYTSYLQLQPSEDHAAIAYPGTPLIVRTFFHPRSYDHTSPAEPDAKSYAETMNALQGICPAHRLKGADPLL